MCVRVFYAQIRDASQVVEGALGHNVDVVQLQMAAKFPKREVHDLILDIKKRENPLLMRNLHFAQQCLVTKQGRRQQRQLVLTQQPKKITVSLNKINNPVDCTTNKIKQNKTDNTSLQLGQPRVAVEQSVRQHRNVVLVQIPDGENKKRRRKPFSKRAFFVFQNFLKKRNEQSLQNVKGSEGVCSQRCYPIVVQATELDR